MTLIFLLCYDIALSFTDIDMRLLKKILYYQCLDLEVHRISKDRERLYELTPGITYRYSFGTHPKETKYSTRVITVNDFGFRDKKRQKVKKNVFRIIVLGSSNTYGVTVSDEDTYPALMQKIFDEKYPGKIEVWNGGICAYVTSQKIAYADYIVKNYDPDLLIIQDNNLGRRAFLNNITLKELKALFRNNQELYAENTPLLFDNPNKEIMKIHYFLATFSRLYRITCAVSYSCLQNMYSSEFPNQAENTEKKIKHPMHQYGRMVNDRNFLLFVEKHKNIPIILFNHQYDYIFKYVDRIKIKKHVKVFTLDSHDKPEEYHVIHPPSYVYEWYAQELCKFLIKNRYIILK